MQYRTAICCEPTVATLGTHSLETAASPAIHCCIQYRVILHRDVLWDVCGVSRGAFVRNGTVVLLWHIYTYIYMISCYIAPRYYRDVIMGAIASQITSLTIVYSTVYSDADQRKRQSSASLVFVWGIHRGPVNSPHKWPVMRKMFPFDDVIMVCCKSTVLLQALYYYTDLTLLQSFQPMAAQLLKKAALPLAKTFVTASCRSNNTGPWDLFVRNGTVWKAVGGNGARGSDITGWMWSKGVKYVIRWRESRATWGRIYRNMRKTLMMTSHTRDFYMKRLMYFIQLKI